MELKEIPPAKNAQELAQRTYEATSSWAKETDENYQLQQKANAAAQSVKAGIGSLFAKVKGENANNANAN